MIINSLAGIKHADSSNFFLMAGPCAIEGEEIALRIADRVVKITDKLNIPYIFKGSYRKANRSRVDSFTGIGDEKALKILQKVKDTFGVPVVTDIHESGAGVGHTEDGFVIFVDGVLPDARSLVKITSLKANHARAEEIERLPLIEEDEEPASPEEPPGKPLRTSRPNLGSREDFWGS